MCCPKCGKQIDNADTFCRYCGQGTVAVTAPQQAASPAGPVTIKNPYSGKNKQILGLVAFFFCMIASFAAEDRARAAWALGSAVGLVIYLVGRFGHWYHAE